ncbi:carbamoyl-phosphate synthase (glutamine-hydrolyzing) cpa2 [Exophiala oligosperma]
MDAVDSSMEGLPDQVDESKHPLMLDDIVKTLCLAIWATLNGMPVSGKSPFFARFFTSQDAIEEIALKAGLEFAPELWDTMQSADAPGIEFFEGLPVCLVPCWGIYAVVLKKPGCRPAVYIGSGTNKNGSAIVRLNQYDALKYLPSRVAAKLDEGFSIVHKGLLCWRPMPPVRYIPIWRLLFVALEAALAFIFWTMYSPKGGDWGCLHLCLWDRDTLEYDGLCSHPAVNETIRGEFDLTEEQLEDLEKDKQEKKVQLKADWHYQQMAENYDEYIGKSSERVARSRANNPGRDAKHQADRIEKALAEKTFHCHRCNISFGTKQRLQDHEKTAKHERKSQEANNPYKCFPCNLGFHNNSNLLRHQRTERHRNAVAALAAAQSSS